MVGAVAWSLSVAGGKKATQRCLCGYLTDPRNRCRCPSTAVARYLAKISGPLLDRIDLHVDVPAVPFDVLTHAPQRSILGAHPCQGLEGPAVVSPEGAALRECATELQGTEEVLRASA